MSSIPTQQQLLEAVCSLERAAKCANVGYYLYVRDASAAQPHAKDVIRHVTDAVAALGGQIIWPQSDVGTQADARCAA